MKITSDVLDRILGSVLKKLASQLKLAAEGNV
jgi:hypothetical protein